MTRNRLFSAAAAVLFAGTILTASATPAQAQGFRIEAHGGWDRVGNGTVRDDGILYGVGVGYDVAVGGGVLLGIEANADFGNLKECAGSVIAAGDELCVRVRRDLSAVGRIGYMVGPQSQIYALAGYTNGRFRADYRPAGGAVTRTSENLDGLRLGAGFQQNLGHGLYSKIEYRYSNYEAGTDRHQLIAGFGIAF
ncbi:MAG: outer membrane protein [Allosphingosinicella sp.]|uniref:outer membrane protein n=1 Tax=Allosphingosinicella sp. TaxID=2823234 RepID=UPI0039288D32